MLRLLLTTFFLLNIYNASSQALHTIDSSRLSATLKQAIQSKGAEEQILVSLSAATGKWPKALAAFQPTKVVDDIYIMKVRVKDLAVLLRDADVLLVSQINAPREELSTGINDLSANRVNFTHHLFSAINGDSIRVSVKERLFDSTDIDLRGRVFKTGYESAMQTAHASLMATIIGGGANSSSYAKGVAAASHLSSASFNNLFPEPDGVYQQHQISVQNHSYGTLIENFYGNEAFAFDRAAKNNASLVFVFSSGNSGTQASTSGPYVNIAGYANLTGNFKQAKNLITVGATDSLGVMQPLSSKGPAFDGRVKPELVAFGEDGSSGAAALVSGSAALLQQAYKKWRGGQLPQSSLVRAVLVNSADDVHVQGPDYTSGFGSLNTYKAIKTISENRFFEDVLGQGGSRSFSITVPPGIATLKVTLAWTDPEAAPNAAKALVNDLDLLVTNSATAQVWQPWVLNTAAHADSLLQVASRGTDTLNNIEQVTLQFPAPGVYTVQVHGSRVTGSQHFSAAYQLDTAGVFYFTYPTASDPLVAGRTQVIRWETQTTGAGTLQYAAANGNWQTIASVPDLSTRYYKWTVPDTVALARLRMLTNVGAVISDTFVVAPLLTLDAGFNCADSFLLYWQRLPVNRYQLYTLGSRYLQPLLQTTDTAVLLNKQQNPSLYYSVAPVVGGHQGLRSNTLNYAAQANSCYIKSFFLHTQTRQQAGFRAEIGSLYNVAEVAFEKQQQDSFFTLEVVRWPGTTQFSFEDAGLKQGENRYRLRLRLANDQTIYSNNEVVYHVPGEKPFFVYPNPLIRKTPLQVLSSEAGRYTLQVVDGSGKVVHRQLLTASRTSISLQNLATGLYILQVHDGEGKRFTQKLVVQ